MTKIFFDGGCRPNPGRMEYAVVMRGQASVTRDAGSGSSIEAEWLALLAALRMAHDLGVNDAVLLGDSAVVIHQAMGVAKCRGVNVAHHFEAYRALAATMPPVRLRKIGRAQNLAGIALARLHPR